MSLRSDGDSHVLRLTGGRRILLEWLILILLATAAMVAAVSFDLFRRADNLIYDRLVWLQREPASNDIIIVAIDDESISRLGRFPWSREVHARLLDRLREAKPAAILYDVLLVDPMPGDDRLASSVAATRPILPLLMETPGRDGQAVTFVPPVDVLTRAGAQVGHANLSPDEDGIIRHAHLAEGSAEKLWPHVAALAACRARNTACDVPSRAAGSGLIREKPFLIPYVGGRQHFRTIPFSAMLAGGVSDDFLRNRIILVGATATGLTDSYATPLAEREALMPGVEVNANIVQALISGRAISPAAFAARLAMALIPLWILFAGFLLAPPRVNFLLGLGLGGAAILASVAAFLLGSTWVSPIVALAGLLVVYPLWAWRRLEATHSYMREELERFRRDPDLLVADTRPVAETVQSDIELLRGAIARARDLQHFVSDTLKGLPDAAIVVAPDGGIQMLNERARWLVGSAEGQHFSLPLSHLTAGRTAADANRKPGPDALPDEIIDRSERLFDVRWSPIFDRSGELGAWVLRLADVTDLRIATRQREEALQLLTHDMRSPQASIIAALSQAREDVEPSLARRIENYARRTLDLADGYVQLARAEAKPLECEEVNFCDIMLDAVDDLWPLSSAKHIQVHTDGCQEEVMIFADRALVTRAVINLVGNAIKYGPPNSQIDCRIDVDDGSAEFSVRDQGPGLSEDQIAALFQPFRQLGTGDGVGLGLAFVRSVAARHGGTVRCESAPGKGSCFLLCLPVIGPPQPI